MIGQTIDIYGEYSGNTISHNSRNYTAHNCLGVALKNQGRLDEAISHCLAALRINPDYEEAHNNLGIALFLKGNTKEAIHHFREALRIEPNNLGAKKNLQNALKAQHQINE